MIVINRTKIVPSNPLKADPTRTATLRRTFERDLSKRFLKLKSLILRLLVLEDAFALRPINRLGGDNAGSRITGITGAIERTRQGGGGTNNRNSQSGTNGSSTERPPHSNASSPTTANEGDRIGPQQDSATWLLNTRWKFLSDSQKVDAFQGWLQTQIDAQVFEGIVKEKIVDAYWTEYARQGYLKGAGRAFDDVRRPALSSNLDFFAGTRDEFLRQSFGRPVAVDKVKLLAGRVFTDLKGVTEQMATQMSRTLTDGLVRGQGMREVARDMNKTIDKIGRKRAMTIARTETIRAHAEGQLDALEQLGVEELGVQVEWSVSGIGTTARGNLSPCELCAPLDGVVMKITEARGLLPRHPN